MKIKWLGHSCFMLTGDNGVRVLTDPFNERVGYELPAVEADIVTTSHGHYDHNYVEIVKGNFKLIDVPGAFSERGIEVKGISTFHDTKNGELRGKNIIYKFIIDGVSVCHCGDLGHVLTPQQLDEIGKVDVLLVPVGGTYTVDQSEAAEVARQLKPSLTIPMHFKTEVLKFPLGDVDGFIREMGEAYVAEKQEIEFDKDNLTRFGSVVVMDYKE